MGGGGSICFIGCYMDSIAVELPNYSTETVDYTPDSLEDMEADETNALEDEDTFTPSTSGYSDYSAISRAAISQREFGAFGLIVVPFIIGFLSYRQQHDD